jgi:hypothetical protein
MPAFDVDGAWESPPAKRGLGVAYPHISHVYAPLRKTERLYSLPTNPFRIA